MKDLKKIEWSDEFLLGNESIDEEHYFLIEIYNELVDQIKNNASKEKFAESLSKMTDYSLAHFKNEEEYMQKFHYNEMDSHINQHNKFIHKVANYNSEYSGFFPPSREEVAMYIKNWWINHIQKVDLKYEVFKKNNGIKVQHNE